MLGGGGRGRGGVEDISSPGSALLVMVLVL